MISGDAKKYIVSPYLFSLSMIGMMGMIVCFVLTLFFVAEPFDSENVETGLKTLLPCVLLMLCTLVLYCSGCIADGFSFWGTYQFTQSAVILRAPLRKKICIAYDDLQFAGIDYGMINGKYQFWIYASTAPIPTKYWGRINKLPITASTIRVQYSCEAYNLFSASLPLKLKKELEKGKTVINTYGEGHV